MRRVRIFQRKNRKGYHVQWRVGGRCITRSVQTKTEAAMLQRNVYREINPHVYTELDLPWQEAVDMYLQTFDLRGLAESSKYEARKNLKLFGDFCHPKSTKTITQRMCDGFILDRQKNVKSAYTVNSSIQRIRTFLNFLQKRRYHPGGIELCNMKTKRPLVKVLTTEKIRAILAKCDTPEWKIRVLLSLTTGIRKQDIDDLPIDAIDLKRATIDFKAMKTGKVAIGQPIPDLLISVLRGYVKKLPEEQTNLFADINVRKHWDRIKSGLMFHVTRQMLRQTFTTLMQMVSSPTAKNLLQHSSQHVTDRYYTDTDLVTRWKVNQLPVNEWL